ncbi:hypothetical protein XA68_17153 [Ophiocordyceps unilateralis]|uniref:Uncharacterized protein n=1 Tax=Ophiocordyceps unilateralis TaxID=268505 RepID=A0A2A9PKZ8_OPHUN|nr:hypothetical protein XA68_17153 [Ophiocordyceps unilateralis]
MNSNTSASLNVNLSASNGSGEPKKQQKEKNEQYRSERINRWLLDTESRVVIGGAQGPDQHHCGSDKSKSVDKK